MPAHQLIPPGGIDLHAALVASSPAAIGLASGFAASLAGGSKAARALGWTGMIGALGLGCLFLLPHGLAAASDYPLGRGWVRLGTGQAWAMVAAGWWSALAWRPDPARECGPKGWGIRTCMAMLLPIALVPALGALAVADGAAPESRIGARWRTLAAVALVLATIGVWLARDPDAGDPIAPRLWAALPLAAAIWPARPRWRPVLFLGALGALLPLPA